MPDDVLAVLNARSQDIFRKLVERYLETGVPVGSRDLSRLLSQGLSPATVRNVMADLEDLGLIAAPHTSAGRLPTQQGLRFFVDAMLEIGAVDAGERHAIEQQIEGRAADGKVEDLLTQASQLLSGLSHGAGVVIAQKSDLVLRHIEFIRLDAERAMVVLVGEDGSVENRVLRLPPGMTANALVEASNYLAHLAVGHTLSETRKAVQNQRAETLTELDELTRNLVEAGLATLSDEGGAATPTVIVRGRANLINDTDKADGVKIFIGSENKLFSLSGSSVILSPYKDANQKVVGVLGVIGPTRLNYARIVPVVDYTANVVSQMLKRKG